MKSVEINGISTYVHRAGRTGAPPVVLLHGNPGSFEDWDFCIDSLAEDFDVIVPEMPGFGRSERPHNFEYTIAGYTLHLDMLLEKLGVKNPHLVMHDLGGSWGLSYAALNPKAVRSLVLINSGFLKNRLNYFMARIWQVPLLGELFQLLANKPAMRAVLNHNNPRPFPDEFINRMYSFQDWGHKKAILKIYRTMHIQAAMQSMAARSLTEAAIPINVLWGKEDIYLPLEQAYFQKEILPNAKLELIEGCGHWPFIDQPELVNSLLLRCLVA